MCTGISQSDVMTAFLQAVLDYGQKAMAGELDIKVSTLSNKLQPFKHPERRHYLNLFEADDILTLTRNTRPLELLAARHGFALIPLDAVPDAATAAEEELQDVQRLAEYQREEDPIKRTHRLDALLRDVLETEAKRREEEGRNRTRGRS